MKSKKTSFWFGVSVFLLGIVTGLLLNSTKQETTIPITEIKMPTKKHS